MACCSIQSMLPSIPSLSSSSLFSRPSVIILPVFCAKLSNRNVKLIGKRFEVCRAMVQQTPSVQGASATYAKEMERLSAKESLLLAFKDAGGFEALTAGQTTDMQKIDVNERIVGLERLNPTPRPTTSPFLEGRWNFEWIGYGSPGLFAARVLSEFPATVATLRKMDLVIKDGYAKITANIRFLNTIENNFILTTKLTVEGPLRMKEEYTEGVLETPTVDEGSIPQQLKGILGQAANTMQQLPAPIKDAVSNGLTIPLNGAFQRLLMISYLDEEILIIRDTSGAPEVLTRVDVAQSPIDAIEEYES
ncbi:putative plastid-lipid-associated protein 13, chloroplastic isoform X2 [Bidens hawaiensis]|uniref:putative plastid-lipid-associated protein 13, chloroplastic isoform X2 n=1 Tax=Bidens hawaiensis TaxID=980011 RepID=UPI0040497484